MFFKKRVLAIFMVLVGLYLTAALTLAGIGVSMKPQHADLALVLGNTVYPNGTPSPRLQARLDETVLLYHKHYFPKVIVSGGIGPEGQDEAKVMKRYLVARGVPSHSVLVDSQGNTTYDSAKTAAALMKIMGMKKVLVISQYFHLPRAWIILKRLGVSDIAGSSPLFVETRDLYSVLREVTACFFYFFK
jgi:vancomycin permeability regulator SanA